VTRLNVLLALTLLGVGVGVYLAYVALDTEAEAFCSGIGDCHTVQSSEYAEVAGIPVALLGLGLYLGLAALVVARRFIWRAEPAPLLLWTVLLAASGAVYSAYLTYLELFEIEAICVWCVTSAAIVTLILVLSLPDAPRAVGRGVGRVREADVS